MAGWNHDSADWKAKDCVVCGTPFKPKSGAHKFCSNPCKGKWQYLSGKVSTETQYKTIPGNWKRYLQRLAAQKKREDLDADILLKLLESQDYKCALSGIPLTCELKLGVKSNTNASIDRIEAGGAYTEDNIQLVCVSLNRWRADTSIEDFVAICREVVKHQDQQKIGD